MKTTLLIEIGAEEIPAGYIQPALNALAAALVGRLDAARIDHGEARTYGTPRRLAVEVADVAAKQKSLTTEMTGPPERVAFDDAGNPTVAAEKFAEKAGVPLKKISVVETPKGRYLCARITEKGGATKKFLQSILPEMLVGLPFPKTMKWGSFDVYFARPIQSVMALLGEQVLSFSVGNIKSGRTVLGHRFLSPGRIKVTAPEQYVDLLFQADVIVDIAQRRAAVEMLVAEAATGVGGAVLPDDELVDIVTNLVETPVPVAGGFDDKFLELPDEILITAMREHQKYFAVADVDGKLLPNFIAVNNTRARDLDLVTTGHERVLRARLEDARFFYRSDVKIGLASMVDRLEGVLFQSKLGSVYEKMGRIRTLAGFLAEAAGSADAAKTDVTRAAQLCKADLVSQVVVEFPKLQGVMGRVYAALGNETDAVAVAIEEHYRPTRSGGKLPETDTGALLAIADKMDSICGCFAIGLLPTGASDPYALRRQGIGIIQIMLARELTMSLQSLIEKSVSLFADKTGVDIPDVAAKVHGFLRGRMSHLLAEEGYPKDVIAAVTAVSVDCLPDVWKRVKALAALKIDPDFEPLAIAFKRVVNIIKKTDGVETGAVGEELFEDPCESALYNEVLTVKQTVAGRLSAGDFDGALRDIASLRGAVDAFFDGVLVMAEDPAVRSNRFALLADIAALFDNLADFSKITT
jgi:glycyl-tRNA synthetase beta chain